MCSVPPYTWYRHYGGRRALSDQVEDAHFFPPIFPYNSTSIFGWEQIFLVNIVLSWIPGHLYISIVVTCGDSFSKRVLDWAINPGVRDSMLEGMPISPGIKEYPQQREKAKANTHAALPLTKRVYQLLYFGLLWWFPLPFHRNVTEKANLIPSWIYSLSSNPWVLLPILSHDGLHFCKRMLTIDWKTWDSSFSRCWPLRYNTFPFI